MNTKKIGCIKRFLGSKGVFSHARWRLCNIVWEISRPGLSGWLMKFRMINPYPVLDNARGHLFRTGCCKPFKKRNPVGCRITKFTTFSLLFINNRFMCFGLFCFAFNPGHEFGPCLCKNKNKRKSKKCKFSGFAAGYPASARARF